MDMYRFHCVLFAGFGTVSVLFGYSGTTRDMKIVAEDTIVGCFEFSDFLTCFML